MRLDYGTQLSPYPIELSIGTLIKPTLREIAKISFDKFNYYEVLIKLSPEAFYKEIKGEDGKAYWNSLSEEEQNNITLYSIVLGDEQLTESFLEVFNFFFEETVIFRDEYFILLKKGINDDSDITSEDDIRGVISENIFLQILNLIQQVCHIEDKEEDIEEVKFKNDIARKIYEKIQKAAKKQEKKKSGDINFILPNIISSVSNNHPTINPINVWDLTIFQLLDSFNRIQASFMYKIDSTRVSVWGDEKKTFDAALWYKNEYDKNNFYFKEETLCQN